jgi:MFS family permease
MGKLAILMATAFVDMIGAVMILPLLPFYAETMGASGFVIGVLISAFSIAQLLSAPLLSVPLWGKKLSDRHGRRPVLVLALAISAISYLVFAFAQSLWLLFVSRAVPGLGGGTVGVVQAYVADASEPEERAKGLGDGARVTRGVVARARVVWACSRPSAACRACSFRGGTAGRSTTSGWRPRSSCRAS